MKRLFAALKIYPDPGFLSSYRSLKAELHKEPVKWVEEHNIHVTLKFFGETGERMIPVIDSVLERCANQTGAFSMALAGLGIFGSSYAPRVVWVGIEPYDRVSGLMKLVHDGLAEAGFERDRQNLVPHLTLGRIKSLRDKTGFSQTIDRYRKIASSELNIGEMVLYESILRREGPEYIVLNRFPFKTELP
jgi:2'-5' RNA ligase